MAAQHEHESAEAPSAQIVAVDEWDRGLSALLRYVDVRGSAPVSANAMAQGVPLGTWADRRREEYWAGRLPVERIDLLEKLPGWTWSGSCERRWQRFFAALTRYAQQTRSSDIGADVRVGRMPLGAWAAAQRAAYAAGTLPTCNAARLAALPGWRWTRTESRRWEIGLQTARNYVAANGTVDTTNKADGDTLRLRQWINRCREDYHAGRLSTHQIHTLEELPGWTWRRSRPPWETCYAALLTYVEEHGHARPPQHAVAAGIAIGQWVREGRRQHNDGRLPRNRAELLETLPGWRWSAVRKHGEEASTWSENAHRPTHPSAPTH